MKYETIKVSNLTRLINRKKMALSESVEASLKEAEQSLRNALAFAARQERPMVCSTIAEMIGKIESVISY